MQWKDPRKGDSIWYYTDPKSGKSHRQSLELVALDKHQGEKKSFQMGTAFIDRYQGNGGLGNGHDDAAVDTPVIVAIDPGYAVSSGGFQGTDAACVSKIARLLNEWPRKTLDFRTHKNKKKPMELTTDDDAIGFYKNYGYTYTEYYNEKYKCKRYNCIYNQ